MKTGNSRYMANAAELQRSIRFVVQSICISQQQSFSKGRGILGKTGFQNVPQAIGCFLRNQEPCILRRTVNYSI